MNALTAALKEELNVEMISLGGLQVPESVVVSWGIMLFLVIVSILLTRWTTSPGGRPSLSWSSPRSTTSPRACWASRADGMCLTS